MKTWPIWKKCIFLIISFLILLKIGYIVFRGDLNQRYMIENSVDITNAVEVPCVDISQSFSLDYDNLNKIEIMLSGIADDKVGAITIQICKEDEILYQTDVSLANINSWDWEQVYVNIPIDCNSDYQIKMDSTEECTLIPNVILVDGSLAVKYGYLESPGPMDKIVNSSIWLLALLLLYIILTYFEFIKKWLIDTYKKIYGYVPEDVFNVAVQILLCMSIVGGCGIEFQNSTKVLLYTASLCSAYKLRNRIVIVKEIFKNTASKALLCMLYFYCAFSFVGQRLLIYPLNLTITVAKIFVFLITVLWSIPVINSIIYLIITGYEKMVLRTPNRKISTYKFIILLALLLLVPAAYHLFANNPGISSPDTSNAMIINAKHLHGMTDWHPAFYCMVLRAILTVWDSTYAIIFVQYFFWVYVMIEFMLFIRSKGLKDSIIIFVAAFSGMNAGNFIHLNTIWKDIPYTLSLLWVLVILAKLLIDKEFYKTKWYIYLELIVSLVGVFLYRKNGVVSFAVIALFMAIILRKSKRMWVSIGTAIALICCIKGPVYSYFEIEDTGRRGMYIGLSQDILGAYYSDGEVSEETIKMINVMTNYNNAEYPYTPTWSSQSYDLDVDPIHFITCYIDTFLKNPILMSRAIINRGDAIWDIFPGEDSYLGCVNYTDTMDRLEMWAENYPKRIYRNIYDQMSMETAYTVSNQWIASIEWRSGLFTLFGLITIIVILAKRGMGKYILLASPIIGHILSLLLSTGWSDFRYFWALNLMNMCMVLLVIVVMKGDGERPA